MIWSQYSCEERESHGEVIGLSAEHREHCCGGDVPEGDADQEEDEEEEAELGDEDPEEEGDVDLREVQGGQRDEDQRGHRVLPDKDIEPPGHQDDDHHHYHDHYLASGGPMTLNVPDSQPRAMVRNIWAMVGTRSPKSIGSRTCTLFYVEIRLDIDRVS